MIGDHTLLSFHTSSDPPTSHLQPAASRSQTLLSPTHLFRSLKQYYSDSVATIFSPRAANARSGPSMRSLATQPYSSARQPLSSSRAPTARTESKKPQQTPRAQSPRERLPTYALSSAQSDKRRATSWYESSSDPSRASSPGQRCVELLCFIVIVLIVFVCSCFQLRVRPFLPRPLQR